MCFYYLLLVQLVYLPDRKHDSLDNDNDGLELEFSRDGILEVPCLDDSAKFDKRNRRRGMLGWLKLQVCLFSFLYLCFFE